MSQYPKHDFLLVLPHLQIQNANAVSSPLTHGFPSITAFLGLMWALERKVREQGLALSFKAIGVVCHDHQEQSIQSGFVGSFCLTRNPIDKDGSTAAIVEEGRIHLEISLVLAVDCPRWLSDPDERKQNADQIAQILTNMRIAGGTLLPPNRLSAKRHQAYVVDLSGNEEERGRQFSQTRMRLLPGYALVARDDLLTSRLAALQTTQPDATRLDAWLSLSRINWHYAETELPSEGTVTAKAPKSEWQHDRKDLGWIVPIPVGYGALGETHPPGSVANARDSDTPFCFVESLYSVGEWLSPHRLNTPQELLWYADSQPDNGLYRCRNDYRLAHDSLNLQYDFD